MRLLLAGIDQHGVALRARYERKSPGFAGAFLIHVRHTEVANRARRLPIRLLHYDTESAK
jgi:hypothetical protein